MNILMICTEKLPVPPIRGGAIQTYIDGITGLLSKEQNITILSVDDPDLPTEEVVDNIRYRRIPGRMFEKYREGVIDFLQANSFDLIHIFNRPRLVLSVREVAPTARLVLSMHNDMFTPQKIDQKIAAEVINQLDQIITVSNYVGTTIKNSFPQATSKLKTIYSGVDLNRFMPSNTGKTKQIRDRIRNEHDLQNKKVILFVGRLSANKGVDVLIQALEAVYNKHRDIALVIVGSKWFSQEGITDYIAYVKAIASRLPFPVVNTGFVSPDKIQDWFAAADMFVCPSQWQEPLARVHYEAMAAGLPIVTTDRGGNPEVIEQNVNGFVVESPDDPQSFTEPISKLLSNPTLAKKMGGNGRKLAEENYHWNRVANEVMTVWNNVDNEKALQVQETDNLDVEEQVVEADSQEVEKIPNSIIPDQVTDEIEFEPTRNRLKKTSSSNQDKLREILKSQFNSDFIDHLLGIMKSNIKNQSITDINEFVNQFRENTEKMMQEQLLNPDRITNQLIEVINDLNSVKIYNVRSQRRRKESSLNK